MPCTFARVRHQPCCLHGVLDPAPTGLRLRDDGEGGGELRWVTVPRTALWQRILLLDGLHIRQQGDDLAVLPSRRCVCAQVPGHATHDEGARPQVFDRPHALQRVVEPAGMPFRDGDVADRLRLKVHVPDRPGGVYGFTESAGPARTPTISLSAPSCA
jgi:hypothetical protein